MLARLRGNELLRHGAITFGSLMTANLANYVYYLAVSRKAGVDGYGAFFAMAATIVVFSVPGIIAMAVLANMAADLAAANARGRLRRLVGRTLTLCAATVLPAVVVASLFGGQISAFYRIGDERVILATIVTIAVTLVVSALRGILQGVQDFRGLAVSYVAEGGTKLALSAFILVAGTDVTFAVAGGGLSVAVAALYALRRLWATFPDHAERLQIRFADILRQYAGVAAGILAITTLSMFDVILVKHYFTSQQAGLYGAAALVGRALYLGVGFLAVVILPKAAARARLGKETWDLLLHAVAIVAIVAAAALLVVYAAPRLVLEGLTGSAYLGAAPLMFRYGIASTMLALANVAVNYKCGLRQFDFVVPVLALMCGEIAAVAAYHPSTGAVVDIVLAGHSVAALASFLRIGRPPQRAL